MRRKRKKTTSPEELAAWRARMEEHIRKLRELVAKGQAELDARRGAEDSAR
jgi:hypothetical protein